MDSVAQLRNAYFLLHYWLGNCGKSKMKDHELNSPRMWVCGLRRSSNSREALPTSELDYTVASSAILCYDCNSLYDPRCGEEFDSFTLGVVNCSLKDPLEHLPPIDSTICRSIKMEIHGKVRVVRQCGYLVDEDEPEKSCRRQTSVGDLYVTYCSCNTDLCNGAGLMQQEVLWITSGVLAFHSLTHIF